MSFARWGEGDLYVYADVSGGVTCCGCWLHTSTEDHDGIYFGESQHFYDLDSLLQHYRDHQVAGHSVPRSLFDPEQYRPEDFRVGN